MKNLVKIFIVLVLLMFAGQNGFAQVNIPQEDTLKSQVRKNQSSVQGNEQNAKEEGNSQKNKGNAVQAVKRIKADRPDMTKAKGARPPIIVRPSGSGVPKGVGKPGGAGKKVGR
jgi:hypothetical protein